MSWLTQLNYLVLPASVSWLVYNLIQRITRLKYKDGFKDKVIFITGASSGLGEALARVLHKLGAKLIITARNIDKLNEIRDELTEIYPEGHRPSTMKLDLAKLEDIPKVVLAAINVHGRVDILINNAGISYRGSIIKTDISVYQELMKVNYFGQVEVIKAFLDHFTVRGKGTIVGIGSIQSQISIPYRSAYSASKHAFQAFLDCLRAELSSLHPDINVLAVNPGYIKTKLSLNALSSDGSSYNKMDETTLSGMDPMSIANDIALAIHRKKRELIIAPLIHRIAIIIRYMFPSLFFILMSSRAKKQRSEYDK